MDPSGTSTATPAATSTAAPKTISEPAPRPALKPAPGPAPESLVVAPPPAHPSEVPSTTNYLLPVLGTAVVLGILGGALMQIRKNKKNNKKEKDDSKCLNFKKLMEEKLNELTDLKKQVKGFVIDNAREKVASQFETFKLIDQTEKEYSKLKNLYEKCIVDPDVTRPNCIIIHGCPGSEAEFMTPEKRTYYKHWIQWVKNQLNLKGIKTEAPLMPSPWKPEYENFKKEFEKYPVSEKTILIGHSCGCAFLVRWLGESKRKINKLILVAPWKVPDESDRNRKEFY